MSKLSAFLNPVQVEETREVVISDRFQEGGRVAPFVIRAIRQEDNSRLIRAATRRVKDRDGVREELDSLDYNRRLVMACVVQPPLDDAELCRAVGTVDPLETAEKLLYAGEYNRLLKAITELNGFGADLLADAKNS